MAPSIANQWAGTFAQPASFTTTPPALQSTVIALTPATSVGSGSGTPTAGDWLVMICGWNQSGLPAATIMGADDTHSFWRAGDVTKSSWAVSPSTGKTRTNAWYTANLARVPGDVYAAPSGAVAGMACTVIEVAGLGPWDVVTGIYSNYAAAATSLNLTLPAPSAAAFLLAAVTGDNSAAGQALAPAGWTTLSTVTAANGSDHTCDAVLTSAVLATSGSVSVNASATSATDLSGVIIGVLQNAASPIPAGANPAWAGRFIAEAAFGAGFATPPDQLTWTTLTDNAWTPTAGQRLWTWEDSGGVQYQQGSLQSGEGTALLANFDGALSPAREGSSGPWSFTVTGTPSSHSYFTVTTAQSASISAGQAFTDTSNPGTFFVVQSVGAPSGGLVNVTFSPAAANVMSSGDTVTQAVPVTGTPIRIRAALGTIGGTTYNRWYTIRRYAKDFPEQRDSELQLGLVPMGLTDIWSANSANCPTPYRGELAQDLPYAQWMLDDQPLSGGVQPTSLLNSAPGNTNPLTVYAAPGGVSVSDQYSTSGADLTSLGGSTVPTPPGVAVSAVAQQSGWLFGDPQSSLSSYATSGPVTASPGSAAWQVTGLLGNTGSTGWFLACNDTNFPALSGGITVAGWFNAGYFGSSGGATISTVKYNLAGQPYSQITLCTLATASAPVAILYLDLSGHLVLETFNASTGTANSIYTSSDLRSDSWHSVHVTLTQTTFSVYVDGGLTAQVSGTATGMTSAWTWLAINADFGTSGGNSLSSNQHSGNVAYSSWTVYPSVLPAWRVRAHYCAGITAFGLLPAPTGLQLQAVNNQFAGQGYTPDGALFDGSYGVSGGHVANYTASAVAVAEAGSYTSGPSARAVIVGSGKDYSGSNVGSALYAQCAAVAPSVGWYTAATANAETNAATVCGTSDSFSAGFGSSATGAGPGQTASGTGASPPSAPSSLGDTVQQRIERILGYGSMPCPRAIDPSSLLVQAACDIGGQPAGQNVQNIVDSDSGLLSVDNNGTLCYRDRAHLAADTAAWTLGYTGLTGMITFDPSQEFANDPARVFTDPRIAPYAPDGATLPVIVPSGAASVKAAQAQYSVRPKPVTSYLQSQTEMQSQVNWLLAQFGTLRRRIPQLKVDAASQPGAWSFVLGANVGDLCSVVDTTMGAPSTTATYRISTIKHTFSFGADGAVAASAELSLEYEPSSYWS